MHKPNVSNKIFRFFGTALVFVMVLSLFSGVSRAATNPPPAREPVEVTPVSLNEVQGYYATQGGLMGIVGVVVELQDEPAALIYAHSSINAATQQTVNQINLIQQKQDAFTEGLSEQAVQVTELFRTQKVYNGIWLRVNANDLDKLAAMPGVKAIHPIIPKTIDLTTSVPLIGAPEVWGGLGEFQGEDMTIGIIDTGIDYIHYNFGGNGIYVGQDFTTLDEPLNAFPTAKVVGGWDFVGDDYNADPTSPTYDPIPVPDPDPMDCYGHGSHVAGIAAGFGVTSDGATYIESGDDTYAALKDLSQAEYIDKFRIGPGVAPKALLYSLRVFGCQGSTDVTEQAIEWAMDPNNDGDLSDHLDVINMSLGSPYGSIYDTSAVASDNAAEAGVIVVASAGNNNDVFYITGSPAVAKNAISVASSVDAGSVVNAIDVTANTAPSPLVPPGEYIATVSAFGPQTFNLPGDLLYFTPTDNGCAAYPADFFAGKIALINRGTCNFTVKVKNAQDAKAIGVLMVNSVSGDPIVMGGSDPTITIPSMMTSLAIGNNLKTDMATGTVSVLLTSDTYILKLDPTIVDTLSTFTSRGPARNGSLLKPDITAPGETIFSTKNHVYDQGVSMSGTSMAAPHLAGVMALLKEIHPNWSVAELKALAMNTATQDLWTSPAHSLTYTPTRIGAGRVSVDNAALSPVIAYNADDPAAVSLSFGAQAVIGTQTFEKSITLMNTGNVAAEYNLAFEEYYQTNPGLTFSLLDANDDDLDNPVSIPAGGSIEVKVQINADAGEMIKALDPTITKGTYRQRMSEAGGYVTLTSTAENPTVRVPVYIAARPASSMGTAETRIALPDAATGTFNLTPTGIPVDTPDDVSLVDVLELKFINPVAPSSSDITSAAALHYIGATSDYPAYDFGDSSMYFGIATYGKWDTSSTVEFDVYIDINEDGVDDYVVYNGNLGALSGVADDQMVTVYCDLHKGLCGADWATNAYPGGIQNTNIFNNNVLLLPVGLTSIGLVDGENTDFNFYVVSYSREAPWAVDSSKIMHYDVAHQSFTAVDTITTGIPMWVDYPGEPITVTYDKAAIADNHSLGLLLLHHHNAEGTAQVLDFNYKTALPLIAR
jgi:subtilisin family serine protease